jgi:hypothetical protein
MTDPRHAYIAALRALIAALEAARKPPPEPTLFERHPFFAQHPEPRPAAHPAGHAVSWQRGPGRRGEQLAGRWLAHDTR